MEQEIQRESQRGAVSHQRVEFRANGDCVGHDAPRPGEEPCIQGESGGRRTGGAGAAAEGGAGRVGAIRRLDRDDCALRLGGLLLLCHAPTDLRCPSIRIAGDSQ